MTKLQVVFDLAATEFEENSDVSNFFIVNPMNAINTRDRVILIGDLRVGWSRRWADTRSLDTIKYIYDSARNTTLLLCDMVFSLRLIEHIIGFLRILFQ